MPVLQIPNHSHCAVCSKAIAFASAHSVDPEERTCSKECAAKFEERIKQSKRMRYMMFGLMGFLGIILVLQLTGRLG